MSQIENHPGKARNRHDQLAPYWAAALFIFAGAGLATNWLSLGAFWKGYVLDMVGPAWNYIDIWKRVKKWSLVQFIREHDA